MTPCRFGEHIQDNSVPAFCDLVSIRVWENLAQLDPGSARNDVPGLRRYREPSEIVSSCYEIPETLTRFRTQRFKPCRRKLVHLVEHARAMFGDRIYIFQGGGTNSKSF